MATKIWGPLGWMTLHSISAIYPENPTPQEEALLSEFMEAFRESITCPHCKGHFTTMFKTYKLSHPEWNRSRYDFFLFICRAHNTVNKRLDKPIYPTLDSCLQQLQDNTKINSAQVYRNAYINYVISNWAKEATGDGMIFMGAAKKMKRINDEYFNPRDTGFANLSFPLDDSVTDFIPEDPKIYNVGQNLPNAISLKTIKKIGFQNGRFKIRP
jgi:hypothetical protein